MSPAEHFVLIDLSTSESTRFKNRKLSSVSANSLETPLKDNDDESKDCVMPVATGSLQLAGIQVSEKVP